MRSKLLPTLVGGASLVLAIRFVAGCAKPDPSHVCSPIQSWSAPAVSCAAPPAPPDAAPPPPPPVEVEAPPAPAPKATLNSEKIDLAETVQFETDSATLLEKSKTLLDEVATLINAHPEITKIQVEGYTDSRSSRAHNLKLSAERAATVKAYLITKDVDGGRLTTKGFGPDKPVADNKTEEGRLQNRRVDFRIMAKK